LLFVRQSTETDVESFMISCVWLLTWRLFGNYMQQELV